LSPAGRNRHRKHLACPPQRPHFITDEAFNLNFSRMNRQMTRNGKTKIPTAPAGPHRRRQMADPIFDDVIFLFD